jgi:hypothetical protein
MDYRIMDEYVFGLFIEFLGYVLWVAYIKWAIRRR